MKCSAGLMCGARQALDTPIATVDEASSVEFRIRRSRRTQGGPRLRPSASLSSMREVRPAYSQHRRQEPSPRLTGEFCQASSSLSPPTQEKTGTRSSNSKSPSGGGSHSIRLSIGQKQLLCFCRALLRDAPILCLDEANSSMDSTMEAEVLVPVIKWCLRKGSVLMVSHRLQHLPSLCHRVGVVGEGQILEIGPPRNLLRDKNSRFFALYAAAKAPGPAPASSAPS